MVLWLFTWANTGGWKRILFDAQLFGCINIQSEWRTSLKLQVMFQLLDDTTLLLVPVLLWHSCSTPVNWGTRPVHCCYILQLNCSISKLAVSRCFMILDRLHSGIEFPGTSLITELLAVSSPLKSHYCFWMAAKLNIQLLTRFPFLKQGLFVHCCH